MTPEQWAERIRALEHERDEAIRQRDTLRVRYDGLEREHIAKLRELHDAHRALRGDTEPRLSNLLRRELDELERRVAVARAALGDPS